jgi:hypothetical protein
MTYPTVYNPAVANTMDQENIELCKILDAVSGVGYDYEFEDYIADGKPQIVVIKNGSQVLKTLTLTYDGGNNLASIVRS